MREAIAHAGDAEALAGSLYALKPRFQEWLRPQVRRLWAAGITANQVTLLACAGSVGLGVALFMLRMRGAFILLPVWLFLRMALNAIDGMLAREFAQQSRLGAYLNELCDLISDTTLLLPFAVVTPFGAGWVALVAAIGALTEVAGILGLMVGASRRYDGPLGKSDRAFALAVLGLLTATTQAPAAWLFPAMPLLAIGSALTVANRVRAGLREGLRAEEESA